MTAKSESRVLLVVGGPAGLPEALQALVDPQTLVKAIPNEESPEKAVGASLVESSNQTVILLAPEPDRDESESWLVQARRVLARAPTAHVVLLSSLEVYGPDHRSLGMVDENAEPLSGIPNGRAEFWNKVEGGLREFLRREQLLVLRSAQVIGQWADGWFNRLLRQKRVATVMGYDPSLQLIHETDLVRAVHTAIEKRLTGVYNLAPGDALPLHKILLAAAVGRLALPWLFLRSRCRAGSGGEGKSSPAARFAYLRYACTASGERFAEETGIRFSTRSALEQFLEEVGKTVPDFADYTDPHGLDAPFIHRAGNGWLKFLEKVYFRVERKGFEHIPEHGPAILVGPHRGFMPLDAVTVVQMVTKYTGRVPRFLLHPSLVKLGVLAPFMRRMGGVMACKKNADGVLQSGELLGIYPEGIRGPFKYYREVYELGRFGRPDYAKFALEHAAPVVPFVIVGCAEIYPIFGKLNWNWVKKHLEWPFLPITLNLFGLPLPSKWHLQFLPPVHPADALAEAEQTGREPYQVIVDHVKRRIEDATAEMRRKRKSVFFGNVFTE